MYNLWQTQRKQLLQNGLLLLLSLLFLIFAFLPIHRVTMEIEVNDEDNTFHFDLSIPTAIQFFFDAHKELSDEDLEDSALYEKIIDLSEELEDELDELDSGEEMTPSMIRKMEKFQLYIVRGALQHESYAAPGYMTVALILSVVFLLITIGFFAACAVNIARMLSQKSLNTKTGTALMSLVPVFTVCLNYAFLPFTAGGALVNSMDGVELAQSMSGTAWAMILLPICYALGVLAVRIVRRPQEFRQSIPTLVKNGVSLVGALVAVIMIFLPVMNSTIKAEFSSSSRKREAVAPVPPQYFTYLDMDEDSDIFESERVSYVQSTFEIFENYSKLEIQRGDADSLNYQFMTVLMSSAGIEGRYLPLFAFTHIFLLLTGLCAGMIATQNLKYVCTGRKSVRLTRVCKVFCVLGAVLAVGMTLTFTILANIAADAVDLDRVYSLSVAAAPIALMIFSLIVACIPAKDGYVAENREEDAPTPEEEAPATEILTES